MDKEKALKEVKEFLGEGGCLPVSEHGYTHVKKFKVASGLYATMVTDKEIYTNINHIKIGLHQLEADTLIDLLEYMKEFLVYCRTQA